MPRSDVPGLGPSFPLVAPLYQSAVYTLPDLDALDQVLEGGQAGYIYARDAHPNARQLADQLTRLEGGQWGIMCGSGMAAISAVLLASLQQGDRVIASNTLYGRTTQLLMQELSRFGIQTTFVDTRDLAQVQSAFSKPAKILIVETLSNPLLWLADIGALAKLTHEHQCKILVDNTFATPYLCRPLELGCDYVIESLTKMLGGHSDVTLGVLCGLGDELPQLAQVSSIWGLASNPFDCWLALRGLATLELRMEAACRNAAKLADWLVEHRGVSRVIYPGREGHLDHALAKRLLQGKFGNMLCFELSGGRVAVNRFMHQAPGIPFSPSLGHTQTTCSHPWSTSHRYTSPAEKKRQGITEGVVRLSVGIESFEQIQAEMAKGFA